MLINRRQILFLSIICSLLILFGECKDNKIVQKVEVKETFKFNELKKYVGNTFGYKGEYWDKDFDFYYNRQKLHNKVIIISPGNFKLRCLDMADGQRYGPFAVEITNSQDSLIDYFSFKDEILYMKNTNYANWNEFDYTITFPKRENIPSINDSLKTLEKNLNSLIRKLNYQKDENSIQLLVSVVFIDLLGMGSVSMMEINEIREIIGKLKKINSHDQVANTIAEYEELLNTRDAFRLRTKEGNLGYWILKVEENNGEFVVKPKFIGDQLFYNFYI